jgi:D-alanine-D-alanine ligase
VVEGLRDEALYALPPVEIRPPAASGFFSYEAKYSGESEEVCPGRFSKAESEELRRLARVMHDALHQRHYSRSDFIVSPRGIYYLETNTAAAVGMTEQSLFPKALAAVGVKFADFMEHLTDLAIAKKK